MADDRILEVNSDDIRRLLAKLTAITKENTIESVLSRGSLTIAEWSKANRLSGPRPQYLDVVTRRLITSVTATPTVKSGNEYTSEVGTNVVYGRIHEYGGMAGRNHTTFIPARPFLRPSLADQGNQTGILNDFVSSISKAIDEAK